MERVNINRALIKLNEHATQLSPFVMRWMGAGMALVGARESSPVEIGFGLAATYIATRKINGDGGGSGPDRVDYGHVGGWKRMGRIGGLVAKW